MARYRTVPALRTYTGLAGGPGAAGTLQLNKLARMRADLGGAAVSPTGARPSDQLLLDDKYAYLREVLRIHDWAGVGRFFQFEIGAIISSDRSDADKEGMLWHVATLDLRNYTGEAWTLADWVAYVRNVWQPYCIIDLDGESNAVGIGADPNQWLQLDGISKLDNRSGVSIVTFWEAVSGFQNKVITAGRDAGQPVFGAPNQHPSANLGWIQAPRSGVASLIFNLVAGAIIGAAAFAAYNSAIRAAQAAAQQAAQAAAQQAAAQAAQQAAAQAAAQTAASAIPEIVVTATRLPTAALVTAGAGATAGAITAATSGASTTPAQVEEIISEASRISTPTVSPTAAASGAATGAAVTAATSTTPAAVEEIITEAARIQDPAVNTQAAAAGATTGAVATQATQQTAQDSSGDAKGEKDGILSSIGNAVNTLIGGQLASWLADLLGGKANAAQPDVLPEGAYPPGYTLPTDKYAGIKAALPWILAALAAAYLLSNREKRKKRRRLRASRHRRNFGFSARAHK